MLWWINRWWAAFVVLATVSLAVPFYDRSSYLAFQGVVYAGLWYLFLVSTVTTNRVPRILDALCVIALCHVGMQIVQCMGLDPWFVGVGSHEQNTLCVGLMGNTNITGALLAFCFPAFLRRRWWIGIPAVLYGLVLARSSGAAVAVAAGCTFYLMTLSTVPVWMRWLGSAGVAAGAAGFCCFVDRPWSFSDTRFVAWQNTLYYAKQHWVLGSGIGHWKEVFARFPLTEGVWWTTAHNEYLQVFFEMGIGAVIIIVGYVFQTGRRVRLALLRNTVRIPLTAVVIIIINSLVNFPFHIATTAMVAVTWMAVLEIEIKEVTHGSTNV